MRKTLLLPLLLLSLSLISQSLQAQMRITEYMYDGTNGEFVEFTNVGAIPVDMTGWSYSDSHRVPGHVSLTAFGTVQPGESVILTETAAADFRTAWNLCNNVKVIGSNATDNLGRADEINLYDASGSQADQLTYNDQDPTNPGTIQTKGKSGWVNAAGLGANIINDWTLSSVGDAEGSYTSTGGSIGSPGKSTRATVSYDPCPSGRMRITEYMYNGANGEFVEFTNVGTTPVDMTGYKYADNTPPAPGQNPGDVNLSAFGIVQPGESVIFTETAAADFRTAWNLCNNVKVIGGNSTDNLGRADEIHLYDASGTQVDMLAYGDNTPLGGIQTTGKSGWVNAAGLGANIITDWTLSSVGDAEGSYTSSGGSIGSPGKSTRAIVAYSPCPVTVPGAPTISIDVAGTTDYLDGGATTSPLTPYAISGTLNDPTDPASAQGITFTIGDDATPVGNLAVTASSSNSTVVPNTNANLTLSGAGASRTLKIIPAAVGYATITVTVNDGTNNTTYVLSYAASSGGSLPSSNTAWHTGIADASAAIPLDDDYMVIANDEDNSLYVYDRKASGLPVKTFDFNAGNLLGLTDGAPGAIKEVDVEAAASSPSQTGRSYWLGSMSNSSSFNDKPNRNQIIAMDIAGTGAATSFRNAGHYSGLRQLLVTWGDVNNYDFTNSAKEGVDPKTIGGFNAEGMAFGPDNTTLYIGFRAPLVPAGTDAPTSSNRTLAVIAPIQNFESWFNNGSPAGTPAIGTPIKLDLGGRGIRDMIRLSNGNYVIAAGSYDGTQRPAIYTWTGKAGDAAVAQPSFDLTGQNAEAIVPVNQGSQLALDQLQVISDDGDNAFYNDPGTPIAAKDLTEDNFKKFSSVVVLSSGGSVLPVNFEYFTAQRQGTDVQLNWKTGIAADALSFDVLRSENGTDFTAIQTVPVGRDQAVYAFTDWNAPVTHLYYRIRTRELSGQLSYSTIRIVDGNGLPASPVKVYPNPVSNGAFTVMIDQPGVKTVNIYNSVGMLYKQVAFAETSKDISTASWPKGYYLLRIAMPDGNVVTEKIVVQ